MISGPTPLENSPEPDEGVRINKAAALHGFSWSLAFTVINRVLLPLATTVFVARVLGPETIGAYAIVYGFFMTAEIFRDAGLTVTYMRDQSVDEVLERSYVTLGLLQAAIPALALLGLAGPLASTYGSNDIRSAIPWVALTLFINGFGTVPRAKVLKLGKIKESGFREMAANVVSVVVAIAMVQMGYGFNALVGQLVINALLNVLISYPLAPLASFGLGFKDARRIAKDAASSFGVALMFKVYQLADALIIGKLAGLASAGLYNQARNLAQKPLQLVTVPMTRPLQVAFSQNSNDGQMIGRILRRSLGVSILFVLPLFWIVAIAAEPITLLLLGQKWIGAIPAVQILSLYFAARTVGFIANSALIAGGFARHSMTSHLIGFAGVGIAVVAIPRTAMSLEVLTWIFSLGMAVISVLQVVFALKEFEGNVRIGKSLQRQTVATALTSIGLAALLGVPIEGWSKLLIAIIVGTVVHLLVLGLVLKQRAFAFASVKGLETLYRTL